MNILIADCHKIARMGLSIIIGSEMPNAVICEADNALEALNVLKHKEIEILLMDLKMPDTPGGIEFLEMAINIYPKLKVLVVSPKPERIFAMRCLKVGAYGYIEKNSDPINLKKAVLQVANGKKYLSEDVVEQMTELLTKGKSSDPFSVLTKKEFIIATYLIDGIPNEEINDILNLKPSTLEIYNKRIFEKMQIKSIEELSKLATQYNFYSYKH